MPTPTPPRGFRGAFRTDELARGVYAEAAGIAHIEPEAVAVPADADDAALLVRWAHDSGIALVPRGSGSSMAGGAIGAGVIVDLSRIAAIEPVDVAARAVRVGPGAIARAVDAAARAHELRLPVDPSSSAFCTVGGMASTNAAGAHTLAFGAMRRWVVALDCVFDDGARATIRRGTPLPTGVPALDRFARDAAPRLLAHPPADHAALRKDSSGYGVATYARSGDLVDLLVGSEGTLALFVGVELALAPVAAATSSVLGAFATIEQAVAAAVQARDAGAVACELLDKTFLDVAASGGAGVATPPGTETALLVETEGDSAADAAAKAREIERLFTAAGATMVRLALDPHTEHELWELRHAASPILARLDPSLKSMQFIEDGAVPPERLPDYVRGVRAALASEGIRGVIFGHAGDAHVHVNPLVDVRLPDWKERVGRLLDRVTALVASLGGTLAGEHGDGRLRTPLLARVWSSLAMDDFALVKRAFDPRGILNPGVKVPLAGEQPLGEIKYDPTLPPRPAAVERVLRVVESERAYARSRLEMLEDAESDVG